MNQNRINTENEIILQLLKNPCHGRKIAKELNMPLTTVQRALNYLVSKNVIEYNTVGRNKLYEIRKNIPAKLQVYSAEHYKFAKLIEKYPVLGPLSEDIMKKSIGIAILFGSYAKFIAKKESDIDLYIETADQELKAEIESVNSKLSVKIGKFNKEDLLIKEIIKNHVVIHGVEEYYEKLGFFK